jgi:hypothetical protein
MNIPKRNEVIKWIIDSWQQVTASTITSGFTKPGYIITGNVDDDDVEPNDDQNNPELDSVVNGLVDVMDFLGMVVAVEEGSEDEDDDDV